MTGTIVNVVAIVAGSLLGLLLKRGMPKRVEETLMKIMGVSVLIIGLNGIINSMFVIDADGGLSSSGELLMLCSLVIGAVIGELLNIDDHLNRFGSYIEAKTKADGFSRGFISASIIYCVGAMAIIGSLNDGLTGDSSVLFIKSALDGVNSIIFGASLGIGVAFSAIPVLIYQGGISLLAGVLAPLISDVLLNNICAVGYVIVACIGMNISGICKIRVANLLPALVVPVIYQVVLSLIH